VSARREDEVARIFAECIERAPERREAYLAEACAGDPDLLAEISSLLQSHESAGDFLDALDERRAAALVSSSPEPGPEKEIGPYRIVRELGRGGMGVVYLAERADGQFEQQVALKLVKRGMDSDAILQRFRLERQILARLEHPNIARLIDGGVSESGQPWFALEYVDGEPLTGYCDRHRLGVDARLRLFEAAGRAVQHAHQQLVVHRDLKPSNIMVTSAGEVKLLDFGIAKLLDSETGASAPTLTQAGIRLVTPEYGSPEQIRGEPVTTAADVYALGVILYELLAGRRPFRFDRRSPDAMAELVERGQPTRPSSAVQSGSVPPSADELAAARGTSVPRLRRRLRGDLDIIVLKAIRKEPERRFSSVEALLEDLSRWRTGLPVKARPDTMGYRAVKFLRRHGLATAATLLVGTSLAGGLAVALYQRGVARMEAEKARQVQKFLIDTFEVSDPWQTKGEEVTARELLDKGADRIRSGLADQPEVKGTLMLVIGTLYQKLGLYDRGIKQFEEALDVRTRALGLRHVDVAEAQADLANALIEVAEYDRGEKLIRQAIETRAALKGENDADLGVMLNTLGLILAEKGEYAEAEEKLRRALSIHRRVLGEKSDETISTLGTLGLALRWGGQLEEAEKFHREALELNREAYGNDDPRTAWALERLGVGLAQRGNTEEAKPLLIEGLEIMKRVLGEDHPDTALALNNLAKTMMVAGDPAGAEPLFRQALELNARTHGEESLYITTNLANLAQVLIMEERFDEAAVLQERALALRRKHLGPGHPSVAETLSQLARTRTLQGDMERSEKLYAEALPIARAAWDPSHPELATLLAGYGDLHLRQGRAADAEPLLREALAIREKVLVAGDWQLGEARILLGECLAALHRPDEAKPLLGEGRDLLVAARGEEDRLAVRAADALAKLDSTGG